MASRASLVGTVSSKAKAVKRCVEEAYNSSGVARKPATISTSSTAKVGWMVKAQRRRMQGGWIKRSAQDESRCVTSPEQSSGREGQFPGGNRLLVVERAASEEGIHEVIASNVPDTAQRVIRLGSRCWAEGDGALECMERRGARQDAGRPGRAAWPRGGGFGKVAGEVGKRIAGEVKSAAVGAGADGGISYQSGASRPPVSDQPATSQAPSYHSATIQLPVAVQSRRVQSQS
ncbi:hypothetical protein AOQ84DRAFT_369786 [Glonium stellatum]|uniref:Uncharacterized protein n=1 Tax=Glonium stellatum TaxID=574774 RepID=A0A8E2EN66_9PEZI|nr:hypothetical protein AOQ84DRAFT_369786 [Glonium stellatum]